MAGTGSAAVLARVAVTGVAGLPDLDIELGPMTALIGPRGSGKSQLLASIAWLVGERPPGASAGRRTTAMVSGELRIDGRLASILRRPGMPGPIESDRPGNVVLPPCTFLRARERFGRPRGSVAGSIGASVAGRTGLQSSDAAAAEALVAAVEACCDDCLTGELLLIEEPELLLTPQAQRYLYGLLRRFSEAGNQVVYSTRSAGFVDAAHHDEIVRLDLRHGQRSMRRTSSQALSDAERVRLAAEFDHERSEMFFAQSVVLVEGQTERLSLPFIFRALGHDPDAEGIAIVEVGGKSNLPLAARLLAQLEIPFVAVFDADRGPASAALDAEIHRAAGSAPTVRLDPDFEAVAGIRSHQDKVLHAWRRFSDAPPSSVSPILARVVDAAVGLRPENRPAISQVPLTRRSA